MSSCAYGVVDVQLGWDKIKGPTDPQSWETLKRGKLLFKPLDCRGLNCEFETTHDNPISFLGLKITKLCGTWWFKNFLGYDWLARFFRWKITYFFHGGGQRRRSRRNIQLGIANKFFSVCKRLDGMYTWIFFQGKSPFWMEKKPILGILEGQTAK